MAEPHAIVTLNAEQANPSTGSLRTDDSILRIHLETDLCDTRAADWPCYGPILRNRGNL